MERPADCSELLTWQGSLVINQLSYRSSSGDCDFVTRFFKAGRENDSHLAAILRDRGVARILWQGYLDGLLRSTGGPKCKALRVISSLA
jgi:hypothetical protein